MAGITILFSNWNFAGLSSIRYSTDACGGVIPSGYTTCAYSSGIVLVVIGGSRSIGGGLFLTIRGNSDHPGVNLQ